MEIPLKKRRVDESADFTKCIICQEIKSNELLVKSISDEAYGKVLQYVFARAAYREEKLIEISKLLEGLTEEDLRKSNASFHASCRKGLVSSEKLDRAKARFEKAAESKNASVLFRTSGRPSLASRSCSLVPLSQESGENVAAISKRISRSSTATYDKQLCFFCQTHDDKQPVHAIQTESRGKQLSEFVKSCDNDLYKVFLSSAIRQEDALSIDVQYHRACWTKYVVRAQGIQTKEKGSDVQENKIAADVEFLNLIKGLLSKGKILSLDDAHQTYSNILNDHFCNWSPCRKTVRQFLIDHIDDLEFIRAFQRNKPDRFCLSAAKVAAIEAALNKPSEDSELEVIYDCAKIVRKEINEASMWQFNGSLEPDEKDIAPTKLFTLLQWILSGVVSDLHTEHRTEDVNTSAMLLAQQIMYHTKTDRQVNYKPKKDEEERTFRHHREYPLQVGVGLLSHQQMRSRSMIDVLHQLGVSVDYTRILRIETQLAQAVLRNSSEHNIYIPPELTKGKFIFLSVDNSDFSEDTPDGKNNLHATAMIVSQRKTRESSKVTLDVLNEVPKHKSLPETSIPQTELQPCYVPKNAQPKFPGFDLDTKPSRNITENAQQSDLAWAVSHSITRSQSDQPQIPTWSPYNSKLKSTALPLTTVAMMPLLAAPAHEWSTMLTVLMQAQKITAIVMGENRKTIITFDLQLYEMAVKLQLYKAPEFDHMIFRIGEMHTVMTSLRALGASIEDSGLDDAWVEADIYGPTTKHQILDGNHMKRALTAHSITYSALHDLYIEAFLKNERTDGDAECTRVLQASLEMNAICQEKQYEELGAQHDKLLAALETDNLKARLENFDKGMESQNPLFKFVRDYMKFVGCIMMFVRATREGNWKLHLESLKSLTKYFFAHDRLNYARLVPLYIAQMQKLEVEDPDVYHEFTQGNFCVNKNEIPFCAIGPDHAIEHVNKMMKIRGGLKGLTQQPAAMTRWFLIAPELSRIAVQAEVMVGVQRQMPKHHHDLTDAVIKRYNENIVKLKEVLEANDPFQEGGDLINIITKAVMPTEVKEDISNRDQIGQERFDSFVKERIGTGCTLSVWSPMKKANLKTWKSVRLSKKNKASNTIAALKDDRALFARFLVVVLSRPELDVKESISKFELSEYPRALFTSDGNLRHCVAKSKLLNILEGLLPEQQPPTSEELGRPVVIIDAMAVVQSMGKPTWVKTGRDLANHFVEIIDSRSTHASEVHVVFDRYDVPHSLKEKTRQVRQGTNPSVVYQISADAVIAKVTMAQLLCCNENKGALTIYLASHLIDCKKDAEKTYVVTSKDDCMSSCNLNLRHLRSWQEEADTRMLLHAVDATARGASSITIQSPDTDVLVLALWLYRRLCPFTSLIVGTGGKRRSIALGPLHEAIGEELVNALPGFHAFTGCDQTGTICGKGKVSCWNTLKKSERPILDAFSSLGSSQVISDDTYQMLERYTCQLYMSSTQLSSVQEVRWLLFSKKQYTDEQLPPTQAALHQMIKRANYVALVWKACDTPQPNFPAPTLHGWRQDGDRLQPVPTTLPPAPKAVLQLIKCGCKGKCITMSCSCCKHSLKCTDMCASCQPNCENRNSDNSSSTVNEDSDDEDLQM